MMVTSQHEGAGPSKPLSFWMSTFKDSIARIGSLLLVVDAWDNPTPLRRAWYADVVFLFSHKKLRMIVFVVQVRP